LWFHQKQKFHDKKHPNVLNLTKVCYPALIIDEFQDTDIAQWEMVQLLAPETIIVMADPEQTIHRWRGADPERMEQFKEYFTQSGRNGEVEEVTLTEKHRAEQSMSEPSNIKWSTVGPDSSTKDLMNMLKVRTKIKCKSIVLEKLSDNKSHSIAILCRTNQIADDITDYLRRIQMFKDSRRMPPIECARLGVENSPYEEGRKIIIRLFVMVVGEGVSGEVLQNHLANGLLRELLPRLPQNELPMCSIRSKAKNKERWIGAGVVIETVARDFGLGLVKLRDYVCAQALACECRCDRLTANCIGYIGKAIQRVGRRTWQNSSSKEKRRRIDGIVAQYENASVGRKNERLSVMTVHQSKGREFDTVIIPWFSKADWVEGDFGQWDTTDPETVNLLHTACTRAKNEVIVISPKGHEATWPPY